MKLESGSLCHRSVIVALVLSISMALGTLTGCSDEVAPPQEVALSFFSDLRVGERARAMDSVWPETRDQLVASYDDLEEWLGESPGIRRTDLLVPTRIMSPALIANIEARHEIPEEPEHAESVVLEIEYRDGRSADITLRWHGESKRWFVDLPVVDRNRLRVGETVHGASGQDDDLEDDESPDDELPVDEPQEDRRVPADDRSEPAVEEAQEDE